VVTGQAVTEPVFARPSSTVILVRDGPTGLEMFLVRRHEQSGFASLAYVFPGGTTIPSDTAEASVRLSRSFTPADAFDLLHERGDVSPESPTECFSFWLAAARELLEEAGVLIHDGARLPGQDEIGSARLRSLSDGANFASAVQAMGVELSLERLIYFSHWRTPVQAPKRYDTRFFITSMPAGQEASHCNIETTDSLWISPTEALARSEAKELLLVFPTRMNINLLLPYKSVNEVLEFARSKLIRCVDPIMSSDRSGSSDPEIIACW
jgi:8-oxo-dGTP pyrophosphatase MutT (NUDIX family)